MSFGFERKWFIESKTHNIKSEYTFVEQIYHGHFGRVFRAIHKETSVVRAVKVIIKENQKQLDSFKAEVGALSRLDHPNIVNIFEKYEDEYFLYMVIEYCWGGNVIERIRSEGTFSELKAAIIVKSILSALIYCHNMGICHLDLKPENIMYVDGSQDSDIKIIDFGFASQAPTESEILNEIKGTPYYIAPEVLSLTYSLKSDLWSLGAIIYVLLSGQYPFNGNTVQEILTNVYSGRFSFRLKTFKMITVGAKDLISKLLVKNVDHRLSAQEAYLHEWVQGHSPNINQPLPMEIINNINRFIEAKEIKQAVLMYMACKMTEEELRNLKEIFKSIDKNGDGVITTEELQNSLAQNTGISKKRLETIISGIDINKNGKVDYSEFIASCLGRHIYGNITRATAAFNYFDRDKDGHISAEELKKALFDNEDLSIEIDDRVEKMIQEADTNGDGKIDYMEFLALLSMHTLRFQ